MPNNIHLMDAPLLAAELHYFRIPRDDWELLLVRMRQLGASIITTAVPWIWHAPAPETYDFVGTTDPQRDVVGFVELCARLGLRVLLKPGPYLDAGLLGGGIPFWLLARHPEIVAPSAEGRPSGHDLNGVPHVHVLHPTFVRHAQAWFDAFSDALGHLQAPLGPIIAMQIDQTNQQGSSESPWRCYQRVLADLTASLHEKGWHVPLRRDLLSAFPSSRSPFDDDVLDTYWRAKLWRSRSPQPMVAEGSAAGDFAFAAPFIGGSDGVNLHGGVQSINEPSSIAVATCWGMDAPVRPDGTVRSHFWHAKGPLTLLDAVGNDFPRSVIRADVAVGYQHHSPPVDGEDAVETERAVAAPQPLGVWTNHLGESSDSSQTQDLVQRLVDAGISFAAVDLDNAESDLPHPYSLLLVPNKAVLRGATDQQPRELEQGSLVGDPYNDNLISGAAPIAQMVAHLPTEVNGEEIEALLANHGGHGRYGWADQPDVDVLVRHSTAGDSHPLVYLWIANRRSHCYSGVIAYRAPDDTIEHVNLSIGPRRVGLVVLRAGEVLGASLGGDITEGSWLVRGLQTSIVWSGGPAVVAPYDLGANHEGSVLFVSASAGGRLNLRRPTGWEGIAAYRLLLCGALLPFEVATENTHLILPYIAEDQHGQTDGYIVCPPEEPLPLRLRGYLNTVVLGRAQMLERSATTLGDLESGPLADASALRVAASVLANLPHQHYTADEYHAAFAAADAIIGPTTALLARRLTALRFKRASGAASTTDEWDLIVLEQALATLARAALGA